MEPQHAVPSELEAADRRSAAQTAVRSVPVIFVNPARQACGALSQIAIGATLGPFAQRGLDKGFRFAIGLRSAVTGVQALDLMLFT